MSLEAIEKVAQTERDSQTRKTEAAAEAKRIVAEAEKNGRALVEQARAKAEAEGKVLLQQAEERASRVSADVLDKAKRDGQAMCQAAESKLDAAADFIVRRVVNP